MSARGSPRIRPSIERVGSSHGVAVGLDEEGDGETVSCDPWVCQTSSMYAGVYGLLGRDERRPTVRISREVGRWERAEV